MHVLALVCVMIMTLPADGFAQQPACSIPRAAVDRAWSHVTGIGMAAAGTLSTYIRSQLYAVSTTDPASFVIVGLLMAAVALFACWMPTRRALEIDQIDGSTVRATATASPYVCPFAAVRVGSNPPISRTRPSTVSSARRPCGVSR